MTTDTPAFFIAQANEPVEGPGDIGQMLAEEVQGDIGVSEPDGPGLPQLNVDDFAPQLVWLAITFVALYLLMARVALPRIATVLENRRDRIASDLDTAARLREETDEVIAAYEQELAEARAKAHAIAGETRDKLNKELAEERAKVEETIAAKITAAEAEIAAAKAKALGEVNAVAKEAAAAIVQSLAGIKPTAKDLDEAVKAAKAG